LPQCRSAQPAHSRRPAALIPLDVRQRWPSRSACRASFARRGSAVLGELCCATVSGARPKYSHKPQATVIAQTIPAAAPTIQTMPPDDAGLAATAAADIGAGSGGGAVALESPSGRSAAASAAICSSVSAAPLRDWALVVAETTAGDACEPVCVRSQTKLTGPDSIGGTTCTILPHFGQGRISPIASARVTRSAARQVAQWREKGFTVG
jgi:hypothetical protein